ncbi:MAG: FKBP-type peptidyl-prolyl cis-trans isomerase [Syntrophorhabdaceae bacterium]
MAVAFTRLSMVLCLLVFMSTHLFAAVSASDLKTQNDKESYSIGYEVGHSMKNDGVEVNFEKLIQGLQDAINQKEPRLDAKEMRKLIVDLRKRVREAQLRKVQELIAKKAQESDNFLEENKKKEGVKTTESGLQYRVLKAGAGTNPGPEDFVKVNYRGTFINGKEFDSSYAKGQPARLKVDGVIKGWREALPMMRTGSRWQLFVPPELAYGKGGFGQQIPPNTVLVFDMELLAVEKGDTLSEIYTVLNEDSGILDGFVKSEKTVPIEVRVISGDNVDIVKIDGKDYRLRNP